MRNAKDPDEKAAKMKSNRDDESLPTPSASYRRRAWVEFQRALDPLAPIKPLRRPRS
jgi:hypothetical protein